MGSEELGLLRLQFIILQILPISYNPNLQILIYIVIN